MAILQLSGVRGEDVKRKSGRSTHGRPTTFTWHGFSARPLFLLLFFFYLLPPARASLPAALARWCEPCHSELAERAAVIGGVPVEEGVVPAAAAEARKETLTLLLNGAWMTYVRPSDSGGRTLKVSLRTDGFVPVLHLQGDVAMAVNALSGMEGVRARSPVGLLSCLAPPPLRQPAVLERVHRRRRRRLPV